MPAQQRIGPLVEGRGGGGGRQLPLIVHLVGAGVKCSRNAQGFFFFNQASNVDFLKSEISYLLNVED